MNYFSEKAIKKLSLIFVLGGLWYPLEVEAFRFDEFVIRGIMVIILFIISGVLFNFLLNKMGSSSGEDWNTTNTIDTVLHSSREDSSESQKKDRELNTSLTYGVYFAIFAIVMTLINRL